MKLRLLFYFFFHIFDDWFLWRVEFEYLRILHSARFSYLIRPSCKWEFDFSLLDWSGYWQRFISNWIIYEAFKIGFLLLLLFFLMWKWHFPHLIQPNCLSVWSSIVVIIGVGPQLHAPFQVVCWYSLNKFSISRHLNTTKLLPSG